MKVYIASRFGRRPEMQGYAAELRALGYEVTASWLTREPEFHDDGVTFSGDGCDLRHAAFRDLQDVRFSQVLILFGEKPGGSRGGRWVEFGAALGAGLACIIVGPRENLFAWAYGVHCAEDWQECKATLAGLRALMAPVGAR